MKHLKSITVPFSDPGNFDLSDATQTYGDDFDENTEPCDLSPHGQCEYTWRDNYRICIHRKRESGL